MSSRGYKKYLLTLLTTILVFNYVDRLGLGVVLQSIKVDLQLSDTQLGFLSGIAFAFFYAIMGVPIARWADSGNRVLIISLTALLWSISVILCGLTASFVQLLLVRVAVAVGEAGCIPPAFSLLSDFFSRAERPRAAAIYGMGGGISSLFGYFAAGWLNARYGWRLTFVALGAPGLLLAALAWFTLREPRISFSGRECNAGSYLASRDTPALKEVWTKLWSIRTFRHLLASLSALFFFIYGILQWQPSFLIRSYHFTSEQVGVCLSLIYGATGIFGPYVGGALAFRYAATNERRQLKMCAISVSCSAALWALAYACHSRYQTLALIACANFGLGIVNGPMFATIQTLVPEHMRATSFAIVYLSANLVGMGLGPLAAGILSDSLEGPLGTESLRYALLLLSPGFLWVAWHAWQASRTVLDDLAAAGKTVAIPLKASYACE